MHQFILEVARLVIGLMIFGFALFLCALFFGIFFPWSS
jgi:hypothetical protein